jgi:hypothetical protein
MGFEKISKSLEAQGGAGEGGRSEIALACLDDLQQRAKAAEEIPTSIAEIARLRDSALKEIREREEFLPRGSLEGERARVMASADEKIALLSATIDQERALLRGQAEHYSREACSARAFAALDAGAQSAMMQRLEHARGARLVIEARSAAARSDLALADAIAALLARPDAAQRCSRAEREQIGRMLAQIPSDAERFDALARGMEIRAQECLVNARRAQMREGAQAGGSARIRLALLRAADASASAAAPAGAMPVEKFLESRAARLARGEAL